MPFDCNKKARPVLVYGAYIGAKNPYSLDAFSRLCLEAAILTNYPVVVLTPNPKYLKANFDGVCVKPIPFWTTPRLGLWGVARTIWVFFALPFHIWLLNPELVLFPVAEGAAKIGKYRLVVSVHDLIPLVERKGLSHYYYKFVVKYLAKRADKILVPSQSTSDIISQTWSGTQDKISFVSNGIPLKRMVVNEVSEKTFSNYEPFILYVGLFYQYKNVQLIVKSMAFVERDIKLIVVGPLSQWKSSGLASMAKIFNVDDRIIILSHIGYEALVRLYRSAVALVHVSKMEGFGLTLTEAMAEGCPVIFANRSSMKEIAVGVPISGESEQELAFAITSLQDEDFRAALISEGRARAEEFSDRFVVDKIAKVLRKLLPIRGGT